jgi:hypothetical protein
MNSWHVHYISVKCLGAINVAEFDIQFIKVQIVRAVFLNWWDLTVAGSQNKIFR